MHCLCIVGTTCDHSRCKEFKFLQVNQQTIFAVWAIVLCVCMYVSTAATAAMTMTTDWIAVSIPAEFVISINAAAVWLNPFQYTLYRTRYAKFNVISLHLCQCYFSSNTQCNNNNNNSKNKTHRKYIAYSVMFNLILKQSEHIKYSRTYRSLLNANIVKIICKHLSYFTYTHSHTHSLTHVDRFLHSMFAFHSTHYTHFCHECISDFLYLSLLHTLFLLHLSHHRCIFLRTTSYVLRKYFVNSVYGMYGKRPNALQSTAITKCWMLIMC